MHYRDMQACLEKQSSPRTRAGTTRHCLQLESRCLGLPSSPPLMGNFKRHCRHTLSMHPEVAQLAETKDLSTSLQSLKHRALELH